MVTAVSLNPSIDKTLVIERFQYGSMNRVMNSRKDAGGKAINLSVILSTMGVQVRCIGFLCEENGKFIENWLRMSSVESSFIWTEGAVRTNLKILDSTHGIITEINERGTEVSDAKVQKILDLISEEAGNSDFLVLTGSLPPKCNLDLYAEIIESVEGTNCKCVLDAEGEVLRQGIKAKPYLIKPNRMELEMAVGHKLTDRKSIVEATQQLNEKGIEWVAASLGESGAILTHDGRSLFAPSLQVKVKSTVGAGDSMLAGLISGLLEDAPMEDVLRKGVAWAAASVMSEGTKPAEKAAIQALIGNVIIEEA